MRMVQESDELKIEPCVWGRWLVVRGRQILRATPISHAPDGLVNIVSIVLQMRYCCS